MTAVRLRAEPALLALRGGSPPSIDGDEALRASFMVGTGMAGTGPSARVDHPFTQRRRCWTRHRAYRRAPVPMSPHP